MINGSNSREKNIIFIDPTLFIVVLGLVGFGLIMVASSSFEQSHKLFDTPFHYLINQSIRFIMGFVLAFVVLFIDLYYYRKFAKLFLLSICIMLILVLIPGIGHMVNGSKRWISLGFINVQVSEIAKLVMIIYCSYYIAKYKEQIKEGMFGFVKLIVVIGVVCTLLLLEPDFGSAVVIFSVALILLFIGGVDYKWFLLLTSLVVLTFGLLAVISPYRLARLISFIDPWARPFDSGYQLTQSLIAFGRGGWFGMGLGESIQKLFYLPEAHTDFIFAVVVEELGLIGGILTIAFYVIFFIRGMYIGKVAMALNKPFNGYLAQGITLLISIQMLVNIGVNAGLLPTKGLTLPLISYGGSSILITCLAIGLLFRVHIENKN